MARPNKQVKENNKRGLITHTNRKSPISEQYRTIRTNIEFAAIDEPIRTIVVTSTSPGEGKSTTSANLAVVMAQNGNRVLFIDADMRKPTAHYTFGVLNTKGLTNVLTRQVSLEEAVSQTKIENLEILTCGPIPPNPAELLNSKGMELLLEKTKEQYEVIIIDTPPVMAVTDSQLLANKCDGTVLVVCSGKTDRQMALKAKDLLSQAKAKLLGVVLNKKEVKPGDNYFYYYE
ncbi:CpsD/CapB family tyrosine-protein kinase [Alkalihalophilus lindianensis]|uniref:non-specific protein-tyrosine kinase n=1 Tax=Alkalihalophilus lindianensis TaxID=1630542 RepID=A0ABU3X957_9BACI|nr:CpsD/CapB family tyrosine-protein kinase [Alkalihalophilus lindianensis]MDV2684417.1 CpsD/CapB family tyrosine-protein kinase [Alkalihalophilus lindianensis]